MIQILCRCSHRFSVEPALAGLDVQCIKCGRLNDVPLLSDLPNIDEDGTLRLDADPEEGKADRAEPLKLTYARTRIDEFGNELDLRNTPEELTRAMAHDLPIELVGGDDLARPKYDPETGELVRPLALQVNLDPPAEAIPLATRTINYARPEHAEKPFTIFRAFYELLKPLNLTVMLFVLILNMLAFFSMMLSITIIMLIFALVLGMSVMAHYANVIDEIGVVGADELPRFLRNFSMRDDVWDPFVQTVIALGFCFVPLIVANFLGANEMVRIVLFFSGTLLIPTVLLTTTTSGSFLNLAPHRLYSVFITSPFSLLVLGAASLAGGWCYLAGMSATSATFAALFKPAGLVNFRVAILIALGLNALGIFLLHYVAYALGLLHRQHVQQFNWVYHVHARQRPTRTAVGQLVPQNPQGVKATSAPR